MTLYESNYIKLSQLTTAIRVVRVVDGVDVGA
jgi:hypothetical protein